MDQGSRIFIRGLSDVTFDPARLERRLCCFSDNQREHPPRSSSDSAPGSLGAAHREPRRGLSARVPPASQSTVGLLTRGEAASTPVLRVRRGRAGRAGRAHWRGAAGEARCEPPTMGQVNRSGAGARGPERNTGVGLTATH